MCYSLLQRVITGQVALPECMVKAVCCLGAGMPQHLQPELILLVPKLVEAADHTAAAGVLLARLANANREGGKPEIDLRLPVLATLGTLCINPAVAEKVMRAALEVGLHCATLCLLVVSTSSSHYQHHLSRKS